MLGAQRQADRLGAGDRRAAAVDRVAGVGDQRRVARVELGEAEVREPLLGAEQRHDLALGVELDAEAARVVRGDGLAQLGQAAVRRVAVRVVVRAWAPSTSRSSGGGGDVGVADAERDHVDAARAGLGDRAHEPRREVLGERRRDGARSASGRLLERAQRAPRSSSAA